MPILLRAKVCTRPVRQGFFLQRGISSVQVEEMEIMKETKILPFVKGTYGLLCKENSIKYQYNNLLSICIVCGYLVNCLQKKLEEMEVWYSFRIGR